MRKLLILILICFIPVSVHSQFVMNQRIFDGNNISTYIINTGSFDRDLSINNKPGFQWPNGSGKFAIFTTGLTIAAKVNGSLLMASSSYTGEYRPGFISNGVSLTDSRFHIFRIVRGDTTFTNPDYAEWGNMVPYGAPYIDVNNNGLFELGIDMPGVKDASQTIFLCMTDGFPESHTASEGFGGGTDPLMAQAHFTAWCYDNMGLEDVQFRKWEIINKSGSTWNGTIFTLFCDGDIGEATDDFIGCDTLLDLGFVYNSDNMDGTGLGNSYGLNPPAVGICFLSTPKKPGGVEFGLTGFIPQEEIQAGPVCQQFPYNPDEAYRYMKGFKRDYTPWINAVNMMRTKHAFSGDPETGIGWTESDGTIWNCGGDTTGTHFPANPSDKRFIMNTSDSTLSVTNGQKIEIVTAFMMARGSNNLNSVTKLKQLTNTVRNFWQTIGITPISSETPHSFRLHQNYPNPFNPSTKIRFDVPGNKEFVKLIIYDITGREIARLVNQELAPGVYEYEFNGEGFSSGIYFYTLKAGKFAETKKMVLVK